MHNQNNRLPWLIGGTVLLVAMSCVCIIALAVATPRLFRGPDTITTFQAEPTEEIPKIEADSFDPVPLRTVVPNPTPTLAPITPGQDLETQIYTNVYERVNPSVVAIRVIDEEVVEDEDSDIRPFFFNTGEGSGFVIDRDGHIVTNRHVVQGAQSLVVQFYDGILAPAEIIGFDRDTDLAVIKVDPRGLDLRPVSFGNIGELRVGDRVIVIGNPFGNANTLTTGIVSALGRQINLFDTVFQLPEVIQTDAAINPGNSGGPILNAKGEVIGVAFMLQSETRANSGIGFGIPVYFVERVSAAIIEDGEYHHAYLGIRGNGLSPFEIQALGLDVDSGVLVAEVLQDTPADKAGLRGGTDARSVEGAQFLIGGDIIVGIDGQPIKIFNDLLAYLGRHTGPGDTVILTIVRDGETLDISVTLEPRPE
ncbi:MAG: PDZ domain-containing protein [Chloroflexi bacterium]|nr:PDZ domain-containing protein [Chloroflexota bacterium]